jgi:hypothetical protein
MEHAEKHLNVGVLMQKKSRGRRTGIKQKVTEDYNRAFNTKPQFRSLESTQQADYLISEHDANYKDTKRATIVKYVKTLSEKAKKATD